MNAPHFPQPPAATRFCIVRHGETEWNAEKRVQGQTDVPLNLTGRQQAVAAARGLAGERFAALYSSDLRRAHDTAAEIARELGLTLLLEPGVRERHYGRFQGLTQRENAERHPEDHARYLTRDPDFAFGDGESLRDFSARIEAAFSGLAQRHVGKSVAVVAHGGVLDIVYRRATGRNLESPRDFVIPNAAYNWIEIDTAGGWRVLTWAERSHLENTKELAVE